MYRTETRDIDGHEYTVTQIPAEQAFILSARVGRILAPALARAAGAMPSGNLMGADMSAIGDAIGMLVEKLPPQDLWDITKQLLATATRDGDALMKTFSVTMAGQTLGAYKLLAFAFEVNFPDFFDLAAGYAAKLKIVTPPAAPAPLLSPV